VYHLVESLIMIVVIQFFHYIGEKVSRLIKISLSISSSVYCSVLRARLILPSRKWARRFP